MWNLFVTECLKYRNLTLLAALAHTLALLYLLSLGVNMTSRPPFPLWTMIIAALGAAFGLAQMLGHKRGNHWVYLLQRPLGHKRILVSLAAAGCCLLLIAGVLPYLILLMVMDSQMIWGIEFRHYLVLPLAAGTILFAYFLAGFVALNPQRLALLASIVVMLLIINYINMRIFTTTFLMCAWFFAALYLSFKPDPSRPPETPLQLLVTELPIQYGLFWLVSMLIVLGSEVTWTVSGTRPTANPRPDTVFALAQQPAEARMLAALEGAGHPDAALLRRQIEIGEVLAVAGPGIGSHPLRHQRPSLDNQLTLLEEDGTVLWLFSHSAMLFEGIERDTRKRRGWLGPDGFHAGVPSGPRFDSVPWTSSNEYVLTDRALYQLDWDSRSITLRFSLDELGADTGERFSDSLSVGENVTTLLSNRHLYLFRSAELREPAAKLRLDARLPIPNPLPRGLRLQVMELLDGYLVSLLAGFPPLPLLDSDFDLYGESELLLYRTGETNGLIHRRSLPPVLGDLAVYKGFILAPGMRLLIDAWSGFYLNQGKERTFPLLYHDFPLMILLLAGLVSAGSAAFTWHLLRRSRLPVSVRRTWILLNAAGGLVGLISLLLGLYWKKLPLAPAPHPKPSRRPLEACEG